MTLNIEAQQYTIVSLLRSTKREGIEGLIEYMIKFGFFNSPASTKYHGCYPGGLAKHSHEVYTILTNWHRRFDFNKVVGFNTNPQPVTQKNITIATLPHDLCKMGAYLGDVYPYKWNRAQPKGHALLSLVRICKFIKLELIEELMITYHMGLYGIREYNPKEGEQPLVSDGIGTKEERYGKSLRNARHHNTIVKFMYFADELSTIGDRP